MITNFAKKGSVETRENNVNFFVAINWCTSRRVMLLPASCARYLRVFRADLKQPPETNDPEEGRGQSQVSPVKIKRKKRQLVVPINFDLDSSITSGRPSSPKRGGGGVTWEKPSEGQGVALRSGH